MTGMLPDEPVKHVRGCGCFLRAYACAGIVDKPKKERKAKGCTCAPCCQCGYDGQDSDGADCYGKKGRHVLKPGVGRFYGPHCFCWHASEADCPVHGSPESGEDLADLEPCPNAPFNIKEARRDD